MIRVRPAESRDAPALPGIERSSGELFRQFPGLEWIADDEVQSEERHRALMADAVAFVAEVPDGGVAGFLNGEVMPDALHIWQIAVHRDHHRQGIGRQLIDAAQRLAIGSGVGALTLTTFRDVPWNRPYYERLGFVSLAPDDLCPRLEALLDLERRRGLPVTRRCAMRKLLGA